MDTPYVLCHSMSYLELCLFLSRNDTDNVIDANIVFRKKKLYRTDIRKMRIKRERIANSIKSPKIEKILRKSF